jgi:hypothetical protein
MKDKKGWSTIALTGLLDCQMKLSRLTSKHLIRHEKPARNKHSSLLGPFASYKEKRVVNKARQTIFTTLYFLHNLHKFLISFTVTEH